MARGMSSRTVTLFKCAICALSIVAFASLTAWASGQQAAVNGKNRFTVDPLATHLTVADLLEEPIRGELMDRGLNQSLTAIPEAIQANLLDGTPTPVGMLTLFQATALESDRQVFIPAIPQDARLVAATETLIECSDGGGLLGLAVGEELLPGDTIVSGLVLNLSETPLTGESETGDVIIAAGGFLDTVAPCAKACSVFGCPGGTAGTACCKFVGGCAVCKCVPGDGADCEAGGDGATGCSIDAGMGVSAEPLP